MRTALVLIIFTSFLTSGCWDLPFAETLPCEQNDEQCLGNIALSCGTDLEWDSNDCMVGGLVCSEDGGVHCTEDTETGTEIQ